MIYSSVNNIDQVQDNNSFATKKDQTEKKQINNIHEYPGNIISNKKILKENDTCNFKESDFDFKEFYY